MRQSLESGRLADVAGTGNEGGSAEVCRPERMGQ